MPYATRQFFAWLSVLPLTILLSVGISGAKIDSGHYVKSDGRGYYAYLPSLVLDRNLAFEKAIAWEQARFDTVYANDYLHAVPGGTINKYFPGSALLLSPFYAVAAQLGSDNQTGYESHFQYAVIIGAWFYLFFACFFCVGFLRSYHINNRVIAGLLPALFFGTSLFHYTHFEPLMSHVYGFFALSGFFYFSRKFLVKGQSRFGILMGLFLGFAVVIRPTHLVAVTALPLLFHPRPFSELASSYWIKKVVLPFLGLLGPLVVLFTAIYLQSQQFSPMTYKGEGFYFLKPQLFEVLFGFRSGVFLYAPLLFLGVFAFFKKPTFHRGAWFFSFSVITYVIASWWNWYYGDSFGHRAFIDFYLLLALPLAYVFQRFGSKRPIWFGVFLVALVGLSVFQNWQYRQGILHAFDMDAKKYRKIFGQTFTPPVWQGGCDERPFGKQSELHYHYEQQAAFQVLGQGEKLAIPNILDNYHYYVSGSVQFEESSLGAADELFLVFQSYAPQYWLAHPLKSFLQHDSLLNESHFCFVLPKLFAHQFVEFSLWSNSGAVKINAFQFEIEKITY